MSNAVNELKELRDQHKKLDYKIAAKREEALAQLIEESPLYIGCKVRQIKRDKVAVIASLTIGPYNDKLAFHAVQIKKDGTPSKNSAGFWCDIENLVVVE